MTNLIKVSETINANEQSNSALLISQRNGEHIVYAKEMYKQLGLDVSQWSRWYQKNIITSDFFEENKDWVGFDTMSNGNKTMDFALSFDMAKHLSMMSRTEKSHEIRNYFITKEKELQQLSDSNFKIPQTLSQALLLASQQAEVIEQQQLQLTEQAPKVEFFDAVTGSPDSIEMRVVATTLNMGIGRNKIFEILRNKGILDRKNIPYQKFIDCGYFRTVESSYLKSDGTNCINIKTVVFQKGVDAIRKIIKEHINIKPIKNK